MALSSKWFDGGMTPADKQQRELTVRNNRFALDLLSIVIEQEIRGLEANRFEDYNTPGWDYRQADRNGQIRALRDLLKMTKLDIRSQDQ